MRDNPLVAIDVHDVIGCLALGTIDCNPAHHWHDAVVPSPRHSVSWFLPSPYLCSRRTVLKMCFCSWYPPRCYQHRGLLPSYSFLNSGCKTTIFSWFYCYAKYSSLRNQKRVVRDASLCPILPIRLTKFNWLSKPSHGFLLRQAAKPSPDKKPNYFFIPPKFAFSLKLNFLDFHRLAFYLRAFCVNSPNSVFCYRLFS